MTFGKPTDWTEVLDAIAGRVAAALSLDPAYVFPSLDLGDMDHQGGPADVFVALLNPSGRVDPGAVAGGGDSNLAVDGSLDVELWVRCDLDEQFRDTAALKDATAGILAKWKLLVTSGAGLQLYAPLPAKGGNQSILREPMRVVSFSLRPRTVKAGWLKFLSRWDVKFLHATS